MIRIAHISDTHLRDFNPEPADILIHSGDALNYGDAAELVRFRHCLEQIKDNYKLIIYTPGNHDCTFEVDLPFATSFLKETIPNIEVLHERAIDFEGYKIYGTSFQPFFCNWAFNILDPNKLALIYEGIPDDVDILITHCPPLGILDNNYQGRFGSAELANRLPKLTKLKLHCFGHIHGGHGIFKNGETTFSNGAICDEQYLPTNKENIIELL